jgi:cardiolipin synthase
MGCLTVSLMKASIMPVFLGGLVISRDIGLIAVMMYYRFKTLPPPITLKRFFDASLPSITVKPLFISKVNTALQLAYVAFAIASAGFDIPFSSDILRYSG